MKKYRVVLTDYMYETIQPFYDVYGQYEDIEFVPMELTEKAEAAYRAYLRDHAAEALRWLLAERDTAGIAFLLERTAPDRETLSDACALARESGAAEAQAILLEEQHRRFPAGLDKCFDL